MLTDTAHRLIDAFRKKITSSSAFDRGFCCMLIYLFVFHDAVVHFSEAHKAPSWFRNAASGPLDIAAAIFVAALSAFAIVLTADLIQSIRLMRSSKTLDRLARFELLIVLGGVLALPIIDILRGTLGGHS